MSLLAKIQQILKTKLEDNEGWVRQGKFVPTKNLKAVAQNAGDMVRGFGSEIYQKNIKGGVIPFGQQIGQSILAPFEANRLMRGTKAGIDRSDQNIQRAIELKKQGNIKGYQDLLRSNMRNTGQSSNINTFLQKTQEAKKQLPISAYKTAQLLPGINKISAMQYGLGGLLGYGAGKLTGENPYESAGRTMANMRTSNLLLQATNPAQTAIVNSSTKNILNPLYRNVAQRYMSGVTNILEDELLSRAGGERPENQDRLKSFVAGVVLNSGKGDYTLEKLGKDIKKSAKEVGEDSIDFMSKPIKRILKRMQPQLTDKELDIASEKFVRDELGRFAKNAKASPNEPVFYGDLREKIGLSRNGDLPQPGLTTRNITPEERAKIGALEKTKSQIGVVAEKKKTVKQELDNLYTNLVNRFEPLERVAMNVEKSGVSIPSSQDPRITTRQLLGAGGTADYRYKKVFRPIVDKIGDIPKDDFDAFLKAKRDIVLSERGIKGSDAKLAQKTISELGAKYDISKMNQVANELYAYQDNGLKMLREAGIISGETYQKIKNVSKNYVPFQRVMDQVDNYLGLPTNKAYLGTQPIKKIKGSERQILSPLVSIAADTYKIESAVAKNRVAKSFVDLQKLSPELGFVKVAKDAPDAIAVWEGGKKNFYRVGEDVARAIKGLNEENVGLLTKILSAPATLLRQGATGRNIDFMVPNVIKDQLDAAVNSKYGYRPFIDYFRGLAHLMAFSDKPSVSKIGKQLGGSDELVAQWMKSGGEIFGGNIEGRKGLQEQIMDVTTKKNLLKQLGDWAIGGLETVGKYSENPTRLGLFERGLKATGDPLLAMMESREGTLDFAVRGAKTKVANSIIPFFNVGIQGFDKLVRTAKDNPKKLVTKLAIYGGLPAIMTSTYNNYFHPDEYASIPQWEKDTNFLIVIGRNQDGKPRYIKIPKGNIVDKVANPTDKIISRLAGTDRQTFKQFALSILGDTLPVVEGGGSLGEVATRTIGSNIPQAIKPIAENVFNVSTFYTDEKGRPSPVVPSYMDKKEPYQQFYKSTPEVYKVAGKIFNVSPLKIKNLMEGYLAGYVKTPVNMIEVVRDISQGKPIDPNKVAVVRRFLSEREESGMSTTQKPKTSRFGASAKEQDLPTSPQELAVLYKDALNTYQNYSKNKVKAQYGLTSKALEDYQAEFDKANALIKRIKSERPEQLFEVELGIYKSGGGQSTTDRITWAGEKLTNAKDENEFKTMVDKMLKANVLTKNVVEGLRELGFDIRQYTSGGKIKIIGGKRGKAKKITIKSSGKVKMPSIGRVTGASKLPTIKVTAVPKIRMSKKKINVAQLLGSQKPIVKPKAPKLPTIKIK